MKEDRSATSTKSRTTWKELAILAGVVLLFRILYVEIVSYLQADYHYNIGDLLNSIFKEYPLTLLMVGADFLAVQYIGKRYSYGENTVKRIVLTLLAVVVLSSMATLFLCGLQLRKNFSVNDLFASGYVGAIFFVALMVNAVIIGVCDIIYFYRKSHKKALDAEIQKRKKASFQYDQLKRQLNPHFLFNSLNVLDYLVQTDAQRASNFVKKLAGVYRYLLNKEADPIVSVQEEIDFATMYADLLKERFDTGLQISFEIDHWALDSLIIPCSIQIAIENATKHNIVSRDKPLKIRIYTTEDFICISNNIQLRISEVTSNGVGLKSIKGQYDTIFKKHIVIVKNEDIFEVKLPLIARES
jgi:Putative regulator of cell autolysis